MKIILFRGKDYHLDEWRIGNVRFCIDWEGKPGAEIEENGKWFRIKVETIGQFSGMNDKKGTRIFDGDILSRPSRVTLHPISEPVKYVVGFGKNTDDYGNTTLGFTFLEFISDTEDTLKEAEIIGNIYDDPNLIKIQ